VLVRNVLESVVALLPFGVEVPLDDAARFGKLLAISTVFILRIAVEHDDIVAETRAYSRHASMLTCSSLVKSSTLGGSERDAGRCARRAQSAAT
jgi:hypothetical protein